MEPCLFRHGKIILATFLSATYSLQWSHVFSDMVRRISPWSSPCRMFRLQWSHVFSDMVSGDRPHLPRRVRRASMEPCLFRHGKGAETERNGGRRRHASMEPCLFRHGKLLDIEGVLDAKVRQLQWSHVFSDMVRTVSVGMFLTLSVASMEPCLFRHGKTK